MSIFWPQFQFRKITDISDIFLCNNHIKALILDIDNTLTTHDNPHPNTDILAWLEAKKATGLPMMLVSNNVAERVDDFAAKLGLPFVAAAAKPLSKGFQRAALKMGVAPRNIAVVGDQVFTDVLGANLFGAVSIMVEPLGEETLSSIKFKRKLEKIVLRRLNKK